MTHKFTVVLLRPDYIADNCGQDVYVGLVDVADNDCKLALAAAQKEVFKADKKDGYGPGHTTDYALCVMFQGHADPCMFGWQL